MLNISHHKEMFHENFEFWFVSGKPAAKVTELGDTLAA